MVFGWLAENCFGRIGLRKYGSGTTKVYWNLIAYGYEVWSEVVVMVDISARASIEDRNVAVARRSV